MARELVEIKNRYHETLKGYAWTIPDSDKLMGNMVIITGMQETALRYDEFAKFLNKQNYNVYCIDHYGQGENAGENLENLGVWPASAFRKFVNTVDDLVISLRVSCRPTYILGHSMGSFVLQDYIQRHTEHISKVIIMGSARKPFAPKLGYAFAKMLVPMPKFEVVKDESGAVLEYLPIKKGKGQRHETISEDGEKKVTYTPIHLEKEKLAWYKENKFFHSLALGNTNKRIIKEHKEAVKKGTASADEVVDQNAWLTRDKAIVQKYNEDPKCGGVFSGGFYREFFKGMKRLHLQKFLLKIRPSLSIFIVAGAEDPIGGYGKELRKLYNVYVDYGVEDVQLKLYPGMRHEILNEIGKEEVYQDILNFIQE